MALAILVATVLATIADWVEDTLVGHQVIVLLFGLVLATSSSIFIAAPILLNLGEKRLRGRSAPDTAAATMSATAARSGGGARKAVVGPT